MPTLAQKIMQNRAVKVVVFDLDGTLYNSDRLPIRLIWQNFFQLPTLKTEREARRALRGMNYDTQEEFYIHFFAEIGKRHRFRRSVRWLTKWYNRHYLRSMVRILKRHYKMRPGLPGLVDELRRAGLKLAVFSDYECVEEKLKALNIPLEYFEGGVYCSQQFGGLKPSPQSFMRLLTAINDRIGQTTAASLQPPQALMVGDRMDTDGGSMQVGMPFILIPKDLPSFQDEF